MNSKSKKAPIPSKVYLLDEISVYQLMQMIERDDPECKWILMPIKSALARAQSRAQEKAK